MTPDQRDKLDASHDCKPWAPNKYAKCECELDVMFVDGIAPICTHFEAEHLDGDKDWPIDVCVECRHGERCHLKGHDPCETCNGTKVIPSVGDCPECVK